MSDAVSLSPSKPYHHGGLAQASLDAAIELVREQGLDHLSLREVARRLGVSSTALYHHYPDKQSLVVKLSIQGMEAFRQYIDPTDCTDAFEALVKMGQNYIRFFLKHPYYLDLLFVPKHKEDPSVLAIWHATMRDLEDLLAHQGWETAVIPTLGLWLWAGVHGLATMLREGIIGDPDGCGPDASRAFHWDADEVIARVLPLVADMLVQVRSQNSKK